MISSYRKVRPHLFLQTGDAIVLGVGDEAVSRLHLQLANVGTDHVTQVEGPGRRSGAMLAKSAS